MEEKKILKKLTLNKEEVSNLSRLKEKITRNERSSALDTLCNVSRCRPDCTDEICAH